jgi:uncharacterized protein (TIGR03000 family)
MLRKMVSYGGMLLLAGAAIFATPGPGRAQHGGGGHGGGGHFSGGSIGGGHFGGYHGGFYHGGYHSGYYHSYPHYGYHRYYPSYGYYYPSYGTYPYVWSSPAYGSGSYGSYADVTPSYPDGYTSVTPPAASYQSFYPPATDQPDTSAHISVNVPAGARLWFDGTATTATGPVRAFSSPPLTPGHWYTYEVRARWDEDGHEVTQTQQVELTAGAHVNVNFPVPPKTAGQASAVKKG